MLFQALTALFAVIGVYALCWTLMLRLFRRSGGISARILVRAEDSDPATLFREISLLREGLPRGGDLQIWLVHPEGTPWAEFCAALARRDEALRSLSEKEAETATEAFLPGQ